MSETTDSKVTRQFLTMRENLDLANLMIAEYTSSGLPDTEFATYAMTKIKLREGIVIKDHTIKMRRDQYEIPSNQTKYSPRATEADTAMLLAHDLHIKELEERINKLETWINATFPAKGPRKVI
jgi:hypothetical protein